MTLAWQVKLGLNCTNTKQYNKNSAPEQHIILHNINNMPQQQCMCSPAQSLGVFLCKHWLLQAKGGISYCSSSVSDLLQTTLLKVCYLRQALSHIFPGILCF